MLWMPQGFQPSRAAFDPQPAGGGGTVAFDQVSTATNGASNGTTLSWTHTPVGTPTAIVVGVSWYTGDTGRTASATYDGVAMTKDHEADATGAGVYLTSFSLPNPASGAKTLAITFSVAAYASAGAITVTGSDTSQVYRAAVSTASGTDTTPTVTVSSAADDLVVDFLYPDIPSATVGAGQTAKWDVSGLVGIRSQGSIENGAASVTMSWTSSGSFWYIIAGSIKHA